MDSTARLTRVIVVMAVCALVVGAAACGGEKPQPPIPPAEEPKAEVPIAVPPPPPPLPPYPPGVPYEEAFPEDFRGIPPVRIGVLSSANRPEVGQRIALLLGGVQRWNLERRLHKPVKVAFLSRSRKQHSPKTQIRYRPKFLEAAIQVADVIASNQNVRPMSQAELAHEQVDIFVYVGSGER